MKVKIIKKEDDPICPRISAGGLEEIGYYIVYRGELKEIKRIFNLLNNYIQNYEYKKIQEKTSYH